jgi:hypothetical protein
MKNIIGLLILEEPAVADEKFLARMEDITLRHYPAWTLSQSDGAPPHFSRCVRSLIIE